MSDEPLYSLKDAASMLATYTQVIQYVLKRHPEIPRRVVGRMTILTIDAIGMIRPHVEAWKNRERPYSAATA